jgi:hypothetical protein
LHLRDTIRPKGGNRRFKRFRRHFTQLDALGAPSASAAGYVVVHETSRAAVNGIDLFAAEPAQKAFGLFWPT